MKDPTLTLVIGLVVSAVLAVFASVTAPLILLHRSEKMHREDRLADYKRQDEIAARAAAAQKAVADQAAEAAGLLLQSNGKLDVIHALVNSNMTAVMQAELDATRRELALMLENGRLNAAAGHRQTAEALAAIEATTAKVTELASSMNDRLGAAAAAAAAAEQQGKP